MKLSFTTAAFQRAMRCSPALKADAPHTKPAIKSGLVLLLACATASCSLPGYDSGVSNGGAWYSFGSNGSADYQQSLNENRQQDYDPIVVPITPALLKEQARERDAAGLTPAQDAVAANDSTYARANQYVIGKGDILQVIVFGHPELGGTAATPSLTTGLQQGGTGSSLGQVGSASGQLVDADGEIYFPYVGQVQAAGRTVKQLRSSISNQLSNFIRSPQVDVRVVEFRSQEVLVSGDIAKPCSVPVTNVTLTVLQALDRCDTLQSAAQGGGQGPSSRQGVGIQNVTLIRSGKTIPLDINRIYAAGRPIPLQANDRLLIDDSPNRVFMVGEFDEQTALPYSTGGMALSDAIADAGGVKLDTANTGAIYVIRGFISEESSKRGGLQTTVRPYVYKLDASSASGLILANQFQLKPRDVVFAPPAGLVNFNRALAQVTPSLNVLFQSFLLYDRASNN